MSRLDEALEAFGQSTNELIAALVEVFVPVINSAYRNLCEITKRIYPSVMYYNELQKIRKASRHMLPPGDNERNKS